MKWILLDCNYLCHRAKHAYPDFQYGGKATGIIYGFLRYLPYIQESMRSVRLVFCWDSKTSKRRSLFDGYKKSRSIPGEELTQEERQFESEFRHQVKQLRRVYLPMIGFQNIFVQKGVEADDVIASVCQRSLQKTDRAGIVSLDQDLYQLLRPNIAIFNPTTHREFTYDDFKLKYGISPSRFATVKALAGCSTDCVPGIQGVGEVTACKYLKGTLSPTSKIFQRIEDEKDEVLARNIPLVRLPFAGTKKFHLSDDKLDAKGWNEVVRILGMESLKHRMPFEVRPEPTRLFK